MNPIAEELAKFTNDKDNKKTQKQDSTTMSKRELKPLTDFRPDDRNGGGKMYERFVLKVAEKPGTEVHFAKQVLSDKRVGHNSKGEWRQITDPNVSQENSVLAGAIYEPGKGQYWITSTEGEWIRATESAVKNYLENDKGISPKTPNEGGPNPMRESMNFITRTANVEHATPLAGYSTGIYSFDGKRIFVTNSPCIIRPEKGECNTIKTLLGQMLGEQQLEYFFGWLQIAYKALASGNFIQGQIPVFIGPADCGKSLIQNKVIASWNSREKQRNVSG